MDHEELDHKLLSLFKKIIKHRLDTGFDFKDVKQKLTESCSIEAYLYQVRDFNNPSGNTRSKTLLNFIESLEQATSWEELKTKLTRFDGAKVMFFLVKKFGEEYRFNSYPYSKMFKSDQRGHKACFYRSDYYTEQPDETVSSWYNSAIQKREADFQIDTKKLVEQYFKKMVQRGIPVNHALKFFLTFCQHEAEMTSLRNNSAQEQISINIGHRIKSLLKFFEKCDSYDAVWDVIKERMKYGGGFSGLAFPVMALMEREGIKYSHLLIDCPFNRFLFELHLSCFYNPKIYGIKEPEI